MAFYVIEKDINPKGEKTKTLSERNSRERGANENYSQG
jgi:hypothetical protein